MENEESVNVQNMAADLGPASPTMLRLEPEDVGDLDQVLRGYYLGQIKTIDSRKERKLARKLIENHLVLPKSRQRTSKDAAYIREMLGIEWLLLGRLEQSRLIRRLNKTGTNPIYEISHDTLVEPILAERSNREAISRFIKRYGRYFLILLLLLFGFGMFFENWFDVVDDSMTIAPPPPQSVSLQASNGIIAAQGTHSRTLIVPFDQIADFRRNDSLTLYVDVDVTAHPDLDQSAGGDTLALDIGPIPLRLPASALERLIATGRDTAIPMQLMTSLGPGTGPMANIAGTALLQLAPEQTSRGLANARTPLSPEASRRTRGADMIQANLGRTAVQAGPAARIVSLDTVVSLADLLSDDQMARDVLKGRSLRLTYQVDVQPAAPQSGSVQYLPVAGIEVQYPDGTKRFIPSAPGAADQPVSHTVQAGETLYKISKLYGVAPDQLKELNQLGSSTIKVGQVLRVK